jgi:hypothetical protein
MAIVLLFLGLFVTGCQNRPQSKAPEPVVDNPATRYVEGLHGDVRKAEAASEVANKRISEFNTTVEKTADSE